MAKVSFPKASETAYKGYVVKLDLTEEQKKQLDKCFEASKFAWNLFLGLNEYLYHKNMHDNHPDKWQELVDRSAELAVKKVKNNRPQREIDAYNDYLKEADHKEVYELAQPLIQKQLARLEKLNEKRKKPVAVEVARLGHYDMCNIITQLKKAHDKDYILNDPKVAATVPRTAVKTLDASYQAFFNNISHGRYDLAGKPRPMYRSTSCGYTEGVKPHSLYQNKHGMKLQVPKIGFIVARTSRHLPAGKVKTIRLRHTPAGRYYASLSIQQGSNSPLNLSRIPKSKMVGVNLNYSRNNVVTLSNGEVYTLNFDKLEKAMEYTQRQSKKLSVRKNRYEERYAKLKNQLKAEDKLDQLPEFNYDSVRGIREARHTRAKAFNHLDNLRKYEWDEITTKLAREYQLIVIPKLSIRSMAARNPYGKKLLNLSSLGTFSLLLHQKGRKYGCHVIEVDPAYTTQTCHYCGKVATDIFGSKDHPHKYTKHSWICPNCGETLDLHENAAVNVLSKGMDQLGKDAKAQQEARKKTEEKAKEKGKNEG